MLMSKLIISISLMSFLAISACNGRSGRGPISAPNHEKVVRDISLNSSSNESVVELGTRPGATQRVLLNTPKAARASLILCAGGHGNLDMRNNGDIRWGKGNFLVRSREFFVDNGFLVALVDAPSDRKNHRGMLDGFRSSVEHARDIAEVINYLRKKAPVPVWLVGTSRGSTSAANAAIRITRGGPDGLVLTSGLTRWNDKGGNLLDMALEELRMPTLVVHHRNDGCKHTPYSGVRKIMERLPNSSTSEYISFTGGKSPVSRPCGPKSQHGFYGIEEEVVNVISEWIRDHL
jgi:pimeloyl-ACP methyl ester carboxylesterase